MSGALSDDSGTVLVDVHGPLYRDRVTKPGPLFYAVEIEVHQPGSGQFAQDLGRGSHPHGALSRSIQILESTATLRASDLGYRTQEADAGGVVVYPAVLDSAFEIDRRVALEPGQASTRSYGSIRLNNLGQRFDAFIQSRNSDNRPARILQGQKTWDLERGLLLDPPLASLMPFFGGVTLPWVTAELELTIPLGDPAAALDRPLQTLFYLGTGGLQGGPDLAGKPRPMTRGGTADHPVRDVPLVAVDPIAEIFQWTDGAGTLVTLYEGGAAVFMPDGDVPDLYAGVRPAPGHYRTNQARGLVQLGSKPVALLSADVTGSFPVSTAATVVSLAFHMLIEDAALPIASLDVASFTAADSTAAFLAGYYVGTAPVLAAQQLSYVLGSVDGRLVSTRSGLLRCLLMRPIPAGTPPAASLNLLNTLDVKGQALPSTLDPPPFRVQIGYGTIWQPQTSGLNGAITTARQAELATAERYASAFSAAVKAAYRRPNDPAPIASCLLVLADAQTVAQGRLDLFAGRPGYYAVDVPEAIAASIDLGSIVGLNWPLNELAGGRFGQVVGEQIRSVDQTVTFQVLMA